MSDGNGRVRGINTVRVDWQKDLSGNWRMAEIAGSEEFFEADLVLLALGFLGPEEAALKQLGIEQDARSNVKVRSDFKEGRADAVADGQGQVRDQRRGRLGRRRCASRSKRACLPATLSLKRHS